MARVVLEIQLDAIVSDDFTHLASLGEEVLADVEAYSLTEEALAGLKEALQAATGVSGWSDIGAKVRVGIISNPDQVNYTQTLQL